MTSSSLRQVMVCVSRRFALFHEASDGGEAMLDPSHSSLREQDPGPFASSDPDMAEFPQLDELKVQRQCPSCRYHHLHFGPSTIHVLLFYPCLLLSRRLLSILARSLEHSLSLFPLSFFPRFMSFPNAPKLSTFPCFTQASIRPSLKPKNPAPMNPSRPLPRYNKDGPPPTFHAANTIIRSRILRANPNHAYYDPLRAIDF